MREATEVDGVGEAVAAGRKALVAAGGNDERIARRDRLRHLLPQLDVHAAGIDAMGLDLDGEPIVRAGGEADLARGEPAIVETIEAGGLEDRRAGKRCNRAAAAEGGV